MSTIFRKIIDGDIPCHKLYEDDNYLSFLDLRPINPGHALVIPKIDNDYIFDLEDDVLGGLLVAAKPVSEGDRTGGDLRAHRPDGCRPRSSAHPCAPRADQWHW